MNNDYFFTPCSTDPASSGFQIAASPLFGKDLTDNYYLRIIMAQDAWQDETQKQSPAASQFAGD